MQKAEIITGGTHTDDRGTLTFFNDFDMKRVRRFYQIDHPDTTIIRAWQAHQIEQKWFYVTRGSFKVILVQPDNWSNPSPDLSYEEFTLQSDQKQVLHIPGGLANGFQALEPNSRLLVFSNFSMKEAGTDDFRFDKNLWYKWSQ
jgi:dTDP-4-dehydrorhamnose 3,5-epimerase